MRIIVGIISTFALLIQWHKLDNKNLINKDIMKKALLPALCMALLMTACGGGTKSNTTNADSTTVETIDTTSQDTAYCGTYRGTLPAADCPGIKTVLTIKADSTYSLSSDYINRPNGHSEESGIYHKNGDVIELVTPSSGEKTYYKIKDANSIIMTDSAGTEPQGETAKLYILTK